ncbi:zinc finger protein ZAT4-like [Camellia sinensis]|uniref:zinc finger protein ZAT4-like n=1 Tax=Camellia sinensis TaxID=4442 RepID=UPI0010355220|nr:zinc finger protein ZAT4-like [Camellia sinensis]
MALNVRQRTLMVDQDQQTNFKHFCRVCKKGFMCGRALGGHMRAHGIGDESGNVDDDDDPESDWEERGNVPANKRMYALRTNPNRLKSCRVCENCGKEFFSWKSFLEHRKCNSEDAEDADESLMLSPPRSDGEERRGCRWSKRKRSFRAKVGNFNSTCHSSEEEDMAATCLVMLSNARVDPVADQAEESCSSAIKEEERRHHHHHHHTATFIGPLTTQAPLEKAKGVAKGMFECKACKKVFNSHQALGGHRASHKKVKGCFAARLDELAGDEDVSTHEEFLLLPSKPTSSFGIHHHSPGSPVPGEISKRKSKVHECSICHRVFSSGQALGGHKRCHWLTSNSPETSSLVRFDQHNQIQQGPKFSKSDTLDLNLPALATDDLAGIRRDPRNPLSFEVSTEINLQSWVDVDEEGKNYNNDHNNGDDDDNNKKIENNKKKNSRMENVDDDEADSKVKLAKLSELKDMNMSGNSSPWLQVGIGSTSGVGVDSADP